MPEVKGLLSELVVQDPAGQQATHNVPTRPLRITVCSFLYDRRGSCGTAGAVPAPTKYLEYERGEK